MRLGVLTEPEGENRVAIVPNSVKKLVKKGLEVLKLDFPLIGDVRGFGLFLGVEIIRTLESKEPGTLEADYICNRLREERVLIGLEGPFENVLKIRPPLTLDENDVETFLKCFREILGESFLKTDL